MSGRSMSTYIVVADLYLRRGRSSGVRDPEVVGLAQLIGRTPASVSRRLGNFDGTARAGMGLKPVTGEALSTFNQIRDNPAERVRLSAYDLTCRSWYDLTCRCSASG